MRKRADFLKVQKGERRNLGFATVLVKASALASSPARFGLTVTRKVAPSAVDRNRIKRRLRAALFETSRKIEASRKTSLTGFDLVLIARRQVLTAPFSEITRVLSDCLASPHAQSRSKHRPNIR